MYKHRKQLALLATIASLSITSLGLRAQCRFPAHNPQPTITYRFIPDDTPTALVLHVTLEFKASPSGTDTVILPNAWAGETLHALTNLHIVSKRTSITDGAASDTKIIHAPPHHIVLIAYDLHKDWTGPFVAPLQFHPVLMPQYLEFTGSNALVRLKLPDAAVETANFDWTKIPPAWALATSFGTTASTADRCQTFTGSWRKINEGLYAAGDFRIRRFQIGRRPAILAVRGTWAFPDDEAIADIQKTVGIVRDFWHDDNFPYFLVTLAPYEHDSGGSDGSAFTNAFWMFVQPHGSLDSLLPQLAHESFHAWDPEKMGIVPTGYDEDLIKWFREGPTEYYAQLLTYRAGEQSASAYIHSLNLVLRRFPTSDDEYIRGRILSLWLDGTIRKESAGQHSLDDVMFDMVRSDDRPYTLVRILATADQYLSPASRALFQQAVTGHGDLPAPRHLPVLGDCATAFFENVYSYDLGLDLNRSMASHTLTGVVQDGPAYQAGLRNGQPLFHVSVYKNNADRLAQFKVHTDSGDRQIDFYPRGKQFQAWQYELDPSHPCQR